MPLTVDEVIKILERDGWRLVRTTGSHRHYLHPVKPGLVTVVGAQRDLAPGKQAGILTPAGLRGQARGGATWSSSRATTSPAVPPVWPDLPDVIAAAATKTETLALLRAAMAERLALVHVPTPSDSIDITVLDLAGA